MRPSTFKAGSLTALVVCLFLLNGCSREERSAAAETRQNTIHPVKVTVTTVKPTPIRDVLVLPGETEAWQDVRVSADTGGRVEWVGPSEGDAVKKGQLLAKIDVSVNKAALARAEAALKLADDLYQRRKRLFERAIINQEELDRSLTERTLAQGNLRQAQVEYERGFVRAPVSGRVNHLFVDAGEFVDRGKPMVDLVNVDKIRINVNVPELDVRYLKPGQAAVVTIDAIPDQEISGIIDFVAYKADPASRTFRTRIVISNLGHAIRPGMIARVALLRRIVPNALVAPLFALVDKGGERLLFVEKEGRAHARTISIGVIEGDRVQITSGLEAGERLIVVGQKAVEEGMKVEVK